MNNPKPEARNPKQMQNAKSRTGGRWSRSVMECGGPLPVFDEGGHATPPQGPRAVAHSKTLGGIRARDVSRLMARLSGLVFGHSIGIGHSLFVIALLVLPSAFCLRVRGQTYLIDWFSIDGGGGTSTGGVYAVSGSIGQPDAGRMDGGGFTITGGYWSFAVGAESPGVPLLSVELSDGAVIVSWPWPAPGWVLESTNALPSGSVEWPQIPPPYQTNGANLQVTDPAPTGNKFYRLHKP